MLNDEGNSGSEQITSFKNGNEMSLKYGMEKHKQTKWIGQTKWNRSCIENKGRKIRALLWQDGVRK